MNWGKELWKKVFKGQFYFQIVPFNVLWAGEDSTTESVVLLEKQPRARFIHTAIITLALVEKTNNKTQFYTAFLSSALQQIVL